MKKTVMLTIFIISSLFTPALAKRRGPQQVKPIVHQGIKYKVIPWATINGSKQNGGYIEARSLSNNKKIWGKIIYKIKYKKQLERDVQDVFIKKIKLNKLRTGLIIRNELGYIYSLNLKTHEVLHIIKH